MQSIYNHWRLRADQLKDLGHGVKEFMIIYFYKFHWEIEMVSIQTIKNNDGGGRNCIIIFCLQAKYNRKSSLNREDSWQLSCSQSDRLHGYESICNESIFISSFLSRNLAAIPWLSKSSVDGQYLFNPKKIAEQIMTIIVFPIFYTHSYLFFLSIWNTKKGIILYLSIPLLSCTLRTPVKNPV